MPELESNPGFIHLLEFGGSAASVLKSKPVFPTEGPPRWLHLCISRRETADFLMDEADLDPLVVDALLATETRSRILQRSNGVMILLKAMHLHEGAEPENMISLRLWIDRRRIITTREKDIDPVDVLKKEIAAGNGPQDSGDFLAEMIRLIYDDIAPYVEDMEDRLAEMDELVARHQIDMICSNLGSLQRRIAAFLRHLSPQKIVLETLMRKDSAVFGDHHRQNFVESHDDLSRFLETLQDLRDRAVILNEQIRRIQDARQTEASFIFTIAATLFLPLTFLTGLLGVNLSGIPAAESEFAFIGLVLVCLGLTVALVFYFRHKKWF